MISEWEKYEDTSFWKNEKKYKRIIEKLKQPTQKKIDGVKNASKGNCRLL